MIALIDVPCFLCDSKYANLEKIIEVNFTPFPSMRIAFSCFLENMDQNYQDKYGKLLRTSSNPTGIVIVETVAFYPVPKRSKYDFCISAFSVRDSNKEKMSSYIELMKIFYGFTVDYVNDFLDKGD